MAVATLSPAAQNIVDALKDADFYHEERDDSYSKTVANDEWLEVAIDERENEAVLTRYNKNGSRQSYKATSLTNVPGINLLLTTIRNA